MSRFIWIICLLVENVYAINGVIWSRERQTFIPIFEISSFAKLQREVLKKSYEMEKHNFNKQPVRLLFHNDPGIISTYADNTRVTGFFGEIWTYLSEYLNFTLELKKVSEKRVGIRPSLTATYNGLLRYIELNEADVIARIEVYEYWSDVVDFFIPLWNERYRLFTQVSYQENINWMLHLFSYDTWVLLAIFHVLFIAVSLFGKRYLSDLMDVIASKFNYKDYTFYYLGVFTHRNYFLVQHQTISHILNTCACVYSMLILSFYSAKLLSVMLYKQKLEPFNSLADLGRETDYIVLSEKDSVIHLAFEFLNVYQNIELDNPLRPIMKKKRLKFSISRKNMYHTACTSDKNYALLESEYLKEKIVRYGCKFEAVGEAYFHTWIAAAARKNFTYKRSIDLGILKLFESGLLNALKHRLVGFKTSEKHKSYHPINLQKVYLVIGIYLMGVIGSIMILLIEKITFRSKNKVVTK